MMDDELFKPFYEYLKKERDALLTKLDSIERILGISPRTAQLRRMYKNYGYISKDSDGDLAGVIGYDEE